LGKSKRTTRRHDLQTLEREDVQEDFVSTLPKATCGQTTHAEVETPGKESIRTESKQNRRKSQSRTSEERMATGKEKRKPNFSMVNIKELAA